MPRKKKISHEETDRGKIQKISLDSYGQTDKRKNLLSFKTIVLILIFAAALFFWKFKNLFIVATVNGQPISRWYLTRQLVNRFGTQILDNIINERLILASARNKGIFVSSSEIDSRISELEKRLEEGTTLDDALKFQGMTREDFRRQIEIQASIDKLFEKEASVSSEEIDNYISTNSSLYKDSTDTAQVTKEVRQILLQQKINQLFQPWFDDIRKEAKISKFL